MSIKIYIPLPLHKHTNEQLVVEVNGGTVSECLDNLAKQYPDIGKKLFDKNGKLQSYLIIYVNKLAVYPEGLSKPVKDGDDLHILFLIEGG